MYKAVIFDLDGTLLNTLDDLTASVNYILRKYHCPERSSRDVRGALGNGAVYLLDHMFPEGKRTPGFDRILREYGAHYKEHCLDTTAPYEGCMELLGQLKEAGIKMAIVSNKGDDAVRALSEKYFSGLMTCSVGERPGIRRKPEPDSVLEAARLMGTDPADALYVGDSEVDLETADRAGMDCALVTWGFRDREVLEALGPKYLSDDTETLGRIVLS